MHGVQKMLPIVADVLWSVRLSVGYNHSCAKTDEQIEMECGLELAQGIMKRGNLGAPLCDAAFRQNPLTTCYCESKYSGLVSFQVRCIIDLCAWWLMSTSN